MTKKIIWLAATAGVAWLAAVSLRKSAPVADPAAARFPTSGEPSREVTKRSLAPSPSYSSLPVEAVEPPPSLEETLARLSEAILQGLNSTNEAGRELALTNLLPQLVVLDPAAAARLAETLEPEAGRDDALRCVAQGWGAKDPAGALTWADQLPEANERKTRLTDVAFQIAQADPVKAIDAAQQYHLDEGIRDVLPALAVQWADKDLTAALAWAGDRPAGAQRDEIMARLAFVQAQTTPAEAGAMALAEISEGPVQEEAVMSVLNQWAQKDLTAVSTWVGEFPAGPFKERALAELAVASGRRDAAASSTAEVFQAAP